MPITKFSIFVAYHALQQTRGLATEFVKYVNIPAVRTIVAEYGRDARYYYGDLG